MKDYELSPLEREVFSEMAACNPGTTPEMLYRPSIHNDKRYVFHYFATRSRTPLVDISPLARLQGLDEVDLYDCAVRDISPLAGIPTLLYLTISGGPEFLPCDLTPLADLQSLCLHTTPRCTVPRLPGKLSSLSLTGISDLECLRGMDSLAHLNVSGNPGLRDLSPLAPHLQALCHETEEISKGYDGCQVNICLNYGGRDELVRAAQAFAQDCIDGRADPNHLNADQLSGYLYSRGGPDPELIIRTSGELRLSNFLLWQAAYSEFYITDVLWPDFSKEELHRAIASYQSRDRRFGGV